MHPNRIIAAVALLAAPVAWARGGSAGARAPVHGIGAIERRGLEMGTADRAWELAAVRGVPVRNGPLVLAPPMPDEPLQIGVNARPPSGPIQVGSAGVLTAEAADLLWRVRIDASGAGAVRLKFTGLELPAGARIVAAGGDGAGYVIRGRGSMGSGTDWTPVLDGEHGYVECRGPASGGTGQWLKQLTIEEVAEIAAPWPPVGGGERDLLPCHVDVQCQTVDATARDSVGAMVYSVGPATFACTGALLNDTDPGTTLGWFLTSRQCINTQAAANSLTVYWFYQTPECNGTPPALNSLPVSSGATLLVQSASSDVSFSKLAQDPANGQGLAGWTDEEPTGTLWTVHHPLGTHKRVSRGQETTVPPICFGPQGYYQFHYVDYTLGISEIGSTGAPLFNSNWQVTGQLAGTCAVATPTCSNPSQWNAVFGRFSRSFPLVCSYLTGKESSPARVYVNAAATGAGTGLTWEDAYPSLATALLDACPGVGGLDVWVAQGTYKPVGAGREAAFQMLRNVRLYGGFVGGETLLTQRDFAAHPTVLSGDLAGDDGPSFANRSDNAYHVVRGTGVDGTAEINGFFIRGGSANGPTSFNDKGGGLYVEGGSPKVRNCTFLDNDAGYGGGAVAYFFGAVADVADCAFTGNRAPFGGGVSLTSAGGTLTRCTMQGNTSLNDGGGLDLYESSPTVSQCTFKSNTAVDRGGGVSMFISSSPAFVECRFETNAADYGGGGAAVQAGGATFTRCVMIGNTTAHFGGGFLQTDLSTVAMSECRVLGNTSVFEGGGLHCNTGTFTLTNCEVSGNRSTLHGGGGMWQNEECHSTLLNCTFAQNNANSAGGLGVNIGAATVINCILWGNSDLSGSGQGAQLLAAPGTITISYSRVQGWTGTLGGAGNSGADPLFVLPLGVDGTVGTEDDDLGLGTGSSAIDAGNSTAAQALTVDVRGHARKQDDPCTEDAGTGPAPIVDIGAIEASPCACYANCDGSNGNPRLTPNDFLCFIDKYAANDIYANCDGSTGNPPLTPNDFLCFLDKYVAGCS